jgi:hypothetical protein
LLRLLRCNTTRLPQERLRLQPAQQQPLCYLSFLISLLHLIHGFVLPISS